MIVQQLVVVGERWLTEQRLGPCRTHAPVNEDDGLTRAPQLVLQLDPVDGGPFLQLHSGLLH